MFYFDEMKHNLKSMMDDVVGRCKVTNALQGTFFLINYVLVIIPLLWLSQQKLRWSRITDISFIKNDPLQTFD